MDVVRRTSRDRQLTPGGNCCRKGGRCRTCSSGHGRDRRLETEGNAAATGDAGLRAATAGEEEGEKARLSRSRKELVTATRPVQHYNSRFNAAAGFLSMRHRRGEAADTGGMRCSDDATLGEDVSRHGRSQASLEGRRLAYVGAAAAVQKADLDLHPSHDGKEVYHRRRAFIGNCRRRMMMEEVRLRAGRINRWAPMMVGERQRSGQRHHID